jgi:hypothetical protein
MLGTKQDCPHHLEADGERPDLQGKWQLTRNGVGSLEFSRSRGARQTLPC